MLCRISFAVVVVILLKLQNAEGLHLRSLSSSRRATGAPIFSQVEDIETKIEESLPYAVARGDGSTGGGGLAMPKVSEEEDDGLRRPKVGADMPVGRPSWFRVPGPSQGR